MKQSITELSEMEKKFLISLFEDGSKTDAQISREIGVSKATAHRTRKRLEGGDILQDYIPIVSLEKMGINFFAIVMFRWNKFDDNKLTKQMLSDLTKDPHIVYFSAGDSSNGLTHTMMLGFYDLSGYHSYMEQFRGKYRGDIDKINAFFVPSEKILKQDYTGLVKHIIEKTEVN